MKRPKHTARQIEVRWDKPEPFALEIKQTTDGVRVAQEAARREADRQTNDNNQTKFI